MRVCMNAIACVWMSEDNLQDLVLSTVWVLGVKLRLSALAVSNLTSRTSSLALIFLHLSFVY